MQIFRNVSIVLGFLLASQVPFQHPAIAQRACVITDTGKVVCGRLQNNTRNTDSKKKLTLNFEKITLTLQECKRSSSTSSIKCLFLLTPKQDGQGSIYAPDCKMFDTYGREFYCRTVQIGQSSYTENSGGDHTARTDMIKGIPLRASILFEQIPEEVSQISGLRVSVSGYRAIFRSIPVSGEL